MSNTINDQMMQRKIYNFILDFWKTIKLYLPIPSNAEDQRWQAMVNDMSKLQKAYDDGTDEAVFFKDLIQAFLVYSESKSKKELGK